MTDQRPLLAPVALLIATLAVTGCGASNQNRSPGSLAGTSQVASQTRPPLSTAPTSAASPQRSTSPSVRPAAAPEFLIHIHNFAYLPARPVVLAGQRIRVINDDTAAHTWSAAPGSGWTYTSGNLEKGQQATFTGFTKPGTYKFLCYYHAEMPSMNGIITVKPAR